MSSAEDTSSSTASRSGGTSHPDPEEFAVEPHQNDPNEGRSNEGRSSAPLPERPHLVELSPSASPKESEPEPGEEEAAPLKTKPLPKVNAVAHEVRVKVTGARAGSVPGERDLFSESTTTVLVFEKGGVIRLTAAVTPGQLLFLTNEETLREVVTQVIRKRAHRPTECYVELEFTEPAPGFWRMEFSAATALLPKDAKALAALEMVASAETTADEPEEAAPPPRAEEVEALKKEVEALRSQLRLLRAQAEPGQTEPAAPIPNASPAPPAATILPLAEPASPSAETSPWTGFTAKSLPIETEPQPVKTTAADRALPPKPALVFRKALPMRKRSFRARGEFTPGFRTGMLRLAILSCILAALLGVAWYKHWLPGMHESTKFSVSTWAGGVTTKVAMPVTSAPSPMSSEPQNTNTNSVDSPSVSGKEAPLGTASPSETPGEATAGNENGIRFYEPSENVARPVPKGKAKAPASTVKPSMANSLPTKAVNSIPASISSGTLVPPKLIRSERAVASLEDLRDFETGSVVIDAIIDTAGNVTLPIVLTGPPSLRRPALEAIKYYKYEPAMQNGKPVPAHVTVKILFHFE